MFLRSRLLVMFVLAALVLAFVPAIPKADAAGGGVIAYGDVVSGQIGNKTYFELWQFDGTKGDRVQITMTGDGNLDPYMGLIDAATEEVLAEDDDSAGNSNAMIEMTLASTGQFIIVATRYDFDTGSSAGAYELELAGGTGPQNQPVSNTGTNTTEPQEIEPGIYYMGDLELGTPVQGAIDNSSYAQIYTLQLEQGADFVAAMFADGSTLDSYLIFATEDGDVLAEDDDSGTQVDGGKTDAFLRLSIPSSGSYMLIATRSGLDTGKSSGNYALVAGVPESEEPEPVSNNEMPEGVEFVGEISVGAPLQGSIDNTIFIQMYAYDGSAGETITITMAGDANLDSYLGLMDEAGEIIAEDDDSGGGAADMDAQISIRLPESGPYIIIATRNGIDQGSSAGSYTLTVTSGPPPAPEESTGLGGFGGLPGRAFPSDQGTFFLRGSGKSENPDKASDLENFLAPDEGTLPGRSFNVGAEDFYLSGFGKSDDPSKATPLQEFFNQ